jgi:hypothetical protein
MALSVAGIERADEVQSVAQADHQTRLGRLCRRLNDHPQSLFSGGTTLGDLEDLLKSTYADAIVSRRVVRQATP